MMTRKGGGEKKGRRLRGERKGVMDGIQMGERAGDSQQISTESSFYFSL